MFTQDWSIPKRWFSRLLQASETPHCVCFAEGDGCSWLCRICPWGQVCLPVMQRCWEQSASSSSSSSVGRTCIFGGGEVIVLQARLCPYCGGSPGSQQHTGTVLLRFPEPTALPPSVALPAHPEPLIPPHGNRPPSLCILLTPLIKAHINPLLQPCMSSKLGIISSVTHDSQSPGHAGFAKFFSTVTFYGRLHKT